MYAPLFHQLRLVLQLLTIRETVCMMSLRENKVCRWAQAQRSQQNVGSVTHDLSASEEVLNETRSGSTELLELTYISIE